MSDDWMRIVPRDPQFAPPPSEVEQAIADAMRGALGTWDELTFERHDAPVFIDAGSNWEGVRCPSCHADLEETWGDLMDAWNTSGQLVQELPCCAQRTSLNDLDYGSACGFARFAVSVRNPARALTDDQCDKIGELFGVQVRVVLRHL